MRSPVNAKTVEIQIGEAFGSIYAHIGTFPIEIGIRIGYYYFLFPAGRQIFTKGYVFKTFGIRQRHVCARCLELDRNGLAGIAVCVNGFNQGFVGGSGAQTGKQGGAGVREELVFLIFLSLGPV